MYKTTLKIDGMMCSMCENHVNEAIRNAFDVDKITSSHSKGESVIISREALNEDSLKTAVEKTGYKMTGFSSETYEKKGLFSHFKK